MSSSWNHGVMRAASQRSQSSTFVSSTCGSGVDASAMDSHLLRRVDEPPDLRAFAGDHDVLTIAHVRDRTDSLALRVVNPDLRADVAARVEAQHLDVPVQRAPFAQLLDGDPRLVVVGD